MLILVVLRGFNTRFLVSPVFASVGQTMSNKFRPNLLSLESRESPASFGSPWLNPANITVSFAPDQTRVVGTVSQLHTAMDAAFPASSWNNILLSSLQQWASHANLNFGVQVDSGVAFGAAGFSQGDPRFGDIRIGGTPLSPEVYAVASPPDAATSGTWAGDILFNTNTNYQGQQGLLQAVALHEFGHALGLDNSTTANAVMSNGIDPARTTLTAEDISRIQELYGTRAPDSYEGARGNNTLRTAAQFQQPVAYKGETPLVAIADLTTQQDRDFFKFQIPDGNDDPNQSVTVRVQTAGLSLMTPHVRVLDNAGRVLAQQRSTNIQGDVLQLQLQNLAPGRDYFVSVRGAQEGAHAIGRYGVSVRFDKTSGTPDELINRFMTSPWNTVDAQATERFFKQDGDFLISTEENVEAPRQAVVLRATPGFGGKRFDALSSLSKEADVDYFRVKAPATGSILTATVFTPAENGFHPRVTLHNQQGQQLAARVLANGDGTSTLQFDAAQPGTVYYLRVSLDSAAQTDKGNYGVSVRFGNAPTQLRTLSTGVLNETTRTQTNRLTVAEATLFQYVLSVEPGDVGSRVSLTIRNSQGEIVYDVSANAGQTASRSAVLLVPGEYFATFEIHNPKPEGLVYRLTGGAQSNPAGPSTIDPLLTPNYNSSTTSTGSKIYFFPPTLLAYDPATLHGYYNPSNPATTPPGVIPPANLPPQDWYLLSADPFYWLVLGY